MRKKKILILAIVSITVICLLCAEMTYGEFIKDQDSYQARFSYMNGKDCHTIALHEGDELAVDFAIDFGRVDILIGMDGKKPVYKGNDIDSGVFFLEITESGEYTVTVNSRHASGFIKVINSK